MYHLVCTERDAAIRKNADLSLSLREAKKAMTSMPASSSMAVPATPTPASPSTLPPTSLFPSVTASKAKTPSFAVSGATPVGTPKGSSTAKSHGYARPPPPSVGGAITNKVTNEMDDLREKLRLAEERSQQHYDEMKEYQSWLQQVEEGQEALKSSNGPDYVQYLTIHLDYGIEKMAKMLALPAATLAKMGKIGSLEFRERSMRGSSSSHGPSVKTLMYGGQMLCTLSVLHQAIPTLLHGEDGLHQLNYQTQTTLNSLTQVIFACNPLTPSYPLPCRTWWMLRAK